MWYKIQHLPEFLDSHRQAELLCDERIRVRCSRGGLAVKVVSSAGYTASEKVLHKSDKDQHPSIKRRRKRESKPSLRGQTR